MKRKILKIGFGFNNQYLQFSKGTLKTKPRKCKSYEPMKSRVSRIKQKKTLNLSAKTEISLLPEDKRKKSPEVRKYVCGRKEREMNQ